MKIGDLAKQAGCTVETVRYYEREGLLASPERGAQQLPRVRQDALESLRFIRNCRELEMTLEEIRTLVHLKLDSGAGLRRGQRHSGRARRPRHAAYLPARKAAPATS